MTANRKGFLQLTAGYVRIEKEKWFCAREGDAIGLQSQWKIAQDFERKKQKKNK